MTQLLMGEFGHFRVDCVVQNEEGEVVMAIAFSAIVAVLVGHTEFVALKSIKKL